MGVADNNQSAMAVVGDSMGRIVATSVSGSINYHFYGIMQARNNLKELIVRTVGWKERCILQGVCFTYKSNLADQDLEMSYLVDGLLQGAKVRIENFAKSCNLGFHTKEKERMLLIGGASGSVMFESQAGLRFAMHKNDCSWNLRLRLCKKLGTVAGLNDCQKLRMILQKSSELEYYKGLTYLAKALDDLAEMGNPVALEVAFDVAYDLVELVGQIIGHLGEADPVIGLYGQVLLSSNVIYKRVCHLISLLLPQAQLKEASLVPAKGAYLSSLLNEKIYY